MTFLPSIIKRVDRFCKIADFYELMSTAAPDDNTLHAELVSAASQVVNPEVSYTLEILADMYRKALQINGGFQTLYMTVEGITEDLDPEEEENSQVENLLNKIASSLRARAQRPDSLGAMRELQTAAMDAKRRLAERAPEVPEEEGEDEGEMSAYEASIMGSSPEKAFEEEGGVSQFDQTGGVSPEAAQEGKGRGYSVGKKNTPQEWATIYSAEKAKYNNDLNGGDNMVTKAVRTARMDDRVTGNLTDLIGVLDKLETYTKEAIGIEHTLLLETEVPHPQEEKRMDEIRAELRKYEHQRVLLKRRLNGFYKEAELANLQKQEMTMTDPRQKRILQQRVKLQQLRLSGSKGYGKESEERKKLIDILVADPNLGDEQVRKHELAIQQASELTNRVTKAMYDRSRTEEKGREAGRGYVPTREPGGGKGGGQAIGWKSVYQIDFDKATYPVLLKRFRELNNTIVSDAKKYVIRPNEKGDPALTPYVNALSAAIKKKDNAAKIAAITALKAAIRQTLVADPSLRGYLWALRLAPHFKSIEEFLYNIKDKQDVSGKWNLNEAERASLKGAAAQLNRMSEIYERFFPKKGGRYGRSHYMTSVEFYPKLTEYIYKNILQEEPEAMSKQAQETPEKKQLRRERDRIRTIERSKEQAKNIMISREPGPDTEPGGHHQLEKLRNYNPSEASFKGMVALLQERINTAFTTIKQNLTLAKTSGDPALNPLLKELSTAIVRGDNGAKYNAIKSIKSYIDNELRSKQGSYQRLIKLARLMPHLRQLKDGMKIVTEWDHLNPKRKLYVAELINRSERLQQIYSQYYGRGQLDISLASPLEMLVMLTDRLKNVYNQGELNV